MNCEHAGVLIDEFVEGTIAPGDRARLDAHLAGCASCRALADDFRAIRLAAASLERQAPPPRAWARIEAAIEAERGRRWGARLRRLSGAGGLQPLVAAAALLLIIGGATWTAWRQVDGPGTAPRSATAGRPPAAVDPDLARSVETELKLAEEHYQKAIAGLEQITRSESSALDPQVAAVLRKNLEIIDLAIGESRAALQTQPASEVAQESLFEALRNKVALLQDTVVLINEMRKGNQEGAARIVSGINQ